MKKDFDFERFFTALGDKTRLRLLNLIGETEVCVCYFVEVFGTNQPKVSRHLAILRDAELVNVRREGKWAHYRINFPENESARRILSETLEMLKNDSQMRKDSEELNQVCCNPNQFVTIQNAPRPKTIVNTNI
ncbi:MAG: metalloregulator ArsR/SmtB family transcription factor [Pyrinomonadaceae bacterium]|nr:metalloregulator ArsR/SmtB family transcription factor [Pyrinomonadaceae bacterium]